LCKHSLKQKAQSANGEDDAPLGGAV
jgi:hypothetical protein